MYSVRPRFKLVFFNRSVIRTNWKTINARPLQRAGALVRKIARQSIKRDNRKKMFKSGKRGKFGTPSRPGSPPMSRDPQKSFKLIYNLPHKLGTSEIVGMVGFKDFGNPTPGLHEHGGYARRYVFASRKTTVRVVRSVKYPKRAFMFPALLKGRKEMPSLWRNSISAT